MATDSYRISFDNPAPPRAGSPELSLQFPAAMRPRWTDHTETLVKIAITILLGAVVPFLPYDALGRLVAENSRYLVAGWILAVTFSYLLSDKSPDFNWPLFVPVGMWTLCLLFLRPLPFQSQLAVALFACLMFGCFFRWHYRGVSIGSPIPSTLLRSVRKRWWPMAWGKIRPLAAIWDALVSWFTYNAKETVRPGLLSSPVGSALFRTLLTWAAVFPLGFVAHFGLATIHPALLAVLPSGLLLGGASVMNAWHNSKLHALKALSSLDQHWDALVDQIVTSTDPHERDSVFFWRNASDGSPILIPIRFFHHHAWLVGGTGAGKTWRLMAILDQFVARDYSICGIDLKGDSHEILATLQAAVAKARRKRGLKYPIKYITNRSGHASYVFNLFSQSFWKTLPATDRADLILNGLAAAFSRAFGESYFTDICYDLLLYVLQRYPSIGSWRELNEKIAEVVRHAPPHEIPRKSRDNADHIRAIIRRIATLDIMNDDPALPHTVRKSQINLEDLFHEPGILYGSFSSLISNITGPELARLITTSLLVAATSVRPRKTKVLLVLDEWNKMIAGNLASVLQQARSLEVAIILLNQGVQDAHVHTIDLKHVLETNTSIRAWFKVTDIAGLEQLRALGGKGVGLTRSVSQTNSGLNFTLSEAIVDRITANELNPISAEHHLGILQVTDSDAYCDYRGMPFPIQTEFHLPADEYRRRCDAPWPKGSNETITVGASPSSAAFAGASANGRGARPSAILRVENFSVAANTKGGAP